MTRLSFEFSLLMRVILLLTAIAMASGIAQARDQATIEVVTVIGTGTIYGKNMPRARDRAILNGLVSAISRSVENILPIDAQVKNFKTLDQTLYSHTKQFIQEYKILAESVSGKKYRVMVQATVSIEGLRQRLLGMGLGAGKKIMPTILFFIAEQNFVNILPLYWWGEDLVFVPPVSEKIMADIMRKQSFPVIDHGAMIQKNELEPLNLRLDITAREAIAVGVRLKADVVILGKAITQKIPNVMGSKLKSFKGSITANGFRTDTGEEIASTHQSMTAVNTDEVAGGRDALTRATKLAGDEIAAQIADTWLKKGMQPTLVEIQVEGTRYLANFVEFRRIISELAGVEGIQIKEIQPDVALIAVDFQGNAKAFAKALMLKTFDAFGMTISELSDDKLKIELIPE